MVKSHSQTTCLDVYNLFKTSERKNFWNCYQALNGAWDSTSQKVKGLKIWGVQEHTLLLKTASGASECYLKISRYLRFIPKSSAV